ncbi:MAG: NYN domain-containing protein [Thermoanaerobaculia bacterium]|nr:NYN domain-containing protein [Thermoanaerobaculia bacterium]
MPGAVKQSKATLPRVENQAITAASRAAVYIDGFNLYFGLRSKGWKKYYWLDLERFSSQILRPGQLLGSAKYFTARISGPPPKQQRQDAYLRALESTGIKTFFGQYQSFAKACPRCGEQVSCPQCKLRILETNEKMTDVNIATQLLADAYDDRFDTAIIVSADSDLCPPVTLVREKFPAKRVVVCFPPNRNSNALRKVAHAAFTPIERFLRESQFPDVVALPGGGVARRPESWR